MTETNDYHGQATIVSGDQQISVVAMLTRDHRAGQDRWRGSLNAAPGEDFWCVLEVGHAKLQMPCGTTADFVPTNGTIGSGRLIISGSGPAPF